MEKRYTDLLTGLLNMAEAMLVCGSEITRVEDTVTRMGLAYGAVDMNVFVITSCIIITIGTPDGQEMTQKEVANLLGISQSYISRLEKKIMKQLKREMSNSF